MKTQIMTVSEKSLALAKELILNGELVAFHTETVYGLGADARSDEAVKKVFEVKGRPNDNPLISHVHPDFDLSSLIDNQPHYCEILRKTFLPGPLTMVYPSTNKVSRYVSCGLNTLSVRVPSSPTAQAFLREVNIPIVAPSANLSKHVSPVSAKHVFDDFDGKIPLILDGGNCSGGIESTVLDCTGEVPQILRAGLVTREMIAEIVGDCGVYRMQEGEKPKSPGMMYKHYSPRCKTLLFSVEEGEEGYSAYEAELAAGGKPFFLARRKDIRAGYRVLDLGETPEEMAANLYAKLREGEKVATLIIGMIPNMRGGVMEGVLNRMTRACRPSVSEK